MKAMRYLTIAAAVTTGACCSAQAISEYGVVRLYDVFQTTSSGPVAIGNAYGFNAWVDGSGLSGLYTISSPGGTSFGTPITLTGDTSGRSFEDGFAYADVGASKLVYGDGIYTFAAPNGGTAQSMTLTLNGGDLFPIAPTIGGTWVGGKLQVDPTANYNLSFTAFTLPSGSFGANDRIFLGSDDGNFDDFSLSGATTSFVIPAGTLTAGQVYGFELVFVNVTDFDNMTLTSSGADEGFAGYATVVSFDVQAIPEPSTYAAIFGGLALAGVMIERRRRRVTV